MQCQTWVKRGTEKHAGDKGTDDDVRPARGKQVNALVYGFSLFALARSARRQTVAVLVKGGFMLALGLGVLGTAAYKAVHPVMPGSGAGNSLTYWANQEP